MGQYEKRFLGRPLYELEAHNHVQYMPRNRTQPVDAGVEIDNQIHKLTLLRSVLTRFGSLSVDLETKMDEMSIKALYSRILRYEYRYKEFWAKDAK